MWVSFLWYVKTLALFHFNPLNGLSQYELIFLPSYFQVGPSQVPLSVTVYFLVEISIQQLPHFILVKGVTETILGSKLKLPQTLIALLVRGSKLFGVPSLQGLVFATDGNPWRGACLHETWFLFPPKKTQTSFSHSLITR